MNVSGYWRRGIAFATRPAVIARTVAGTGGGPAFDDIPLGAASAMQGPGSWALVVVLTTIYAYAFVDRVILALLVEPIRGALHIGDVSMSLLLGLAFAGFYAIMNIPAGYLVDKVDRRVLIGVTSVLWACMTICCAFARNFNELFLARAGVGLAEAAIGPAAFSLIRDAVPQRSRGLAFSLYAMSPILGGSLALLGGGVLLHAAMGGAFRGVIGLAGLAPWRTVLLLVGVCGLPLGLLLLPFAEPPRLTTGGSRAGSPSVGVAAAVAHVRSNFGVYGWLAAFVTFGAMMTFGQSAWLPAMLGRRWAIPPQQLGPILGGLSLVCGISGLTICGYVVNRMTIRGYDIRSLGAFTALAGAAGLAGAALAPTFPTALACAAVGLFFFSTSFPIGAATLSQATPSALMGKVTGVYLLFQTLAGQALGPTLIALASARLFHGPGGLASAFALMLSLFGVLAAISALALGRTLRRSSAVAGAPQ